MTIKTSKKKKRRKQKVLFEDKYEIPYLAKQDVYVEKQDREVEETRSQSQDDYVLGKLIKKSGNFAVLKQKLCDQQKT